jgi:hypothetical protein
MIKELPARDGVASGLGAPPTSISDGVLRSYSVQQSIPFVTGLQ